MVRLQLASVIWVAAAKASAASALRRAASFCAMGATRAPKIGKRIQIEHVPDTCGAWQRNGKGPSALGQAIALRVDLYLDMVGGPAQQIGHPGAGWPECPTGRSPAPNLVMRD